MELKLNISKNEENKVVPVDEKSIYDLIIIGGGPAGMTAAVYSLRKGLKTAIVTYDIGGQMLETFSIENYMGFRFIEGNNLVNKFASQIKQFELALLQGVYVTGIRKEEKIFYINTNNSKTYKARAVIIAAGKSYRKLGVKGEAEFTGRGVSYCATCDVPLYRDKRVVVVGGGNSGVEAAIELAKISKFVTVLQRGNNLTADKMLIRQLEQFNNKEIRLNAEVLEIIGDDRVKSIRFKENGQEKILDTDGVFVEIGLIPNTGFIKDFLRLNKYGEIPVDEFCRTEIEGCFGAGDISSVPEKQIIVAAGEGAKAALSAYRFLTNTN